jgi:hypothetical protein
MMQTSLSGDAESISLAAAQVSDALKQSQQALNEQGTLQKVLRQLQNSSQAIAQAGQQEQQIAGRQPGQGSQGNNPGQGQSGQGTSGGGTKADTLPPGTGSGQAKSPEYANTDNVRAELGEQIFVPWERRPEEGDVITIPGQDTGQGETSIQEYPNPSGGLPGPALIPYQQVYTQYIEIAQQAINNREIPSAYRDLVRDYFTQLEP